MDNVPLNLQKWIKKSLKKEFEKVVQDALEQDEEQSSEELAQEIIRSKKMSAFLNSMRTAISEQHALSKSGSVVAPESRPQSAFSFASDITGDDWNSPKNIDDHYNSIIDKISLDKPVHVRLAGYEILLNSEFSNLSNTSAWDALEKTLLDGLTDDSKPVFEASLQAHAKLLTSSQSQNVYRNLMNAFNSQYQSQELRELLPTLISGINFKFFLHEKLFRILHLIIRHHEELLKGVRNVDKNTDEIIEQFVTFLSTHEFGNAMQPKTLNMLNVISVLEPRSDWSKRWILSLSTRRSFLSALSKSPGLLQHIIENVNKGLEDPPHSATASIYDEPLEVVINGNTIETVTYLHCLCFVSQLCSYEAGRTVLAEAVLETPFSLSDFLIASLKALNKLSTEVMNGVYDAFNDALQNILDKPKISYDSEFYHAAVCHLLRHPETDIRIWPHTLQVMVHMLNTVDGSLFLITECKEHSVSLKNGASVCPAMVLVLSASNMLKQPFSIMNTEYLLSLFKVMEKLFDMHDSYEAVQDQVEKEFYPAVSYFYNKLDKSFFENESKTQQINSAVRKLLLKMVSIPFGLRALVQESSVLEELIRGSIAPLRTTWTSAELVSFVTSAAFFQLGYSVLADLAPHVLSTLLSQTCKALEEPEHFYDPWDNESVEKFLHILTFFSLNFQCFTAFMTSTRESYRSEEQNIPLNLVELFSDSINPESEYHYLGLLALHTVIWNLNVSIFLMEVLDYQNVLLELQKTYRYMVETEDESSEEYAVDDSALLRHQILARSYFIKMNEEEDSSASEEYNLPTLPPPKPEEPSFPDFGPDSELDNLLQESKPGLLDSNWVMQMREAFKESRDPIKNSSMIQLLDQMQKAIPTAEWVENFQWQENVDDNADFWFLEEVHGLNLATSYVEQKELMQNAAEIKQKLQQFINESYEFIRYKRPNKFEVPQTTANLTLVSTSMQSLFRDILDDFSIRVLSQKKRLAEVLVHFQRTEKLRETLASRISSSEGLRCKTFVTQFVQFPSTMFLWSSLGTVVDRTNEEECSTQFTLMQLIECVVSNELPNIKFALKSNCGTDWSLICNTMISQCFWGILPWSEIMHFFSICILYSPDYIVYYCVSLLYHCQNALMQNLIDGKRWPEHMVLEDYQCHNYITYMDTLGKRYGNKVLPKMAVKESDSVTET